MLAAKDGPSQRASCKCYDLFFVSEADILVGAGLWVCRGCSKELYPVVKIARRFTQHQWRWWQACPNSESKEDLDPLKSINADLAQYATTSRSTTSQPTTPQYLFADTFGRRRPGASFAQNGRSTSRLALPHARPLRPNKQDLARMRLPRSRSAGPLHHLCHTDLVFT